MSNVLPIRDNRGNGVCASCNVYTPITILTAHDGMCKSCDRKDAERAAETFAELADAFLWWEQESVRAYPKRLKDTPEHREDGAE